MTGEPTGLLQTLDATRCVTVTRVRPFVVRSLNATLILDNRACGAIAN